MNKKVYLRALEPDDYKVSVKWRNDDSVVSMLGGSKFFVSSEVEKQWVQNTISQSRDIKLAVCTIEDDIYIGNVYLTDIDQLNRKAKSHILIGNKDFWGSGYGTAAMRLLIDYAFNQRNLKRIEALVLEDNIGSQKMHEKLGYKKEGVLRSSVYKDGRYKDQILYGLLKHEYEPA